jgi:hypothetical protein
MIYNDVRLSQLKVGHYKMFSKFLKLLLAIFSFFIMSDGNLFAEDFRIELESGPVWQSRNAISIPNDEGTRFNLADFSNGPFISSRISGSYTLNKKHVFRAMAAPLQIRTSGNFGEDVLFNDETFSPDERTVARYKFNSYRLGYRYVILDDEKWNIQAGGTLKVRDAKVQLRQGNLKSKDTDIGFVPLLSARIEHHASESISIIWDIEGLGAPQGRAIDSFLGLKYLFSPDLDVSFGYRTLEGGADNSTVYTFSWFHYAVLSLGFNF